MNQTSIEPVTWTEFKDLALPAFDAVLCPKGFERPEGAMRWVNSQSTPIRPMFVLAGFKGGVVAPQWGFSLDFVPHLSGSAFRWHRTAKAALLDVFMDGIGEMELSILHGLPRLRKTLAAVVEHATTQAFLYWHAVSSPGDLPSAFDRTIRHRAEYKQLSFDNLTQPWLAYAFTLAVLGRSPEAETMLKRNPRMEELTPDQRNHLSRLLAEACPK